MYLLGIGFVLGIILGSFAKALADRSLKNRTFFGRSYCPHCKHKLGWYDLLPIFSYIFLSGKCRYCKDKISPEYLIVELVMGLLVGFLFWQASANLQFIIYNFQSIYNFQFIIFISDLLFKTFFISILMILFLTDFKEMFIPDRVILPAIAISTIYLLAAATYKVGYLYYYLGQSTIGKKLLPPYSDYFQRHALITAEPLLLGVFSAFLIGGFFCVLIILTRGKGMGGGDVKLGAFMGLALGFPNAFLALMLAFLSGALVSLSLIFFGKKKLSSHIAFGPFLVFGSLISLYWGQIILDWYLRLRA